MKMAPSYGIIFIDYLEEDKKDKEDNGDKKLLDDLNCFHLTTKFTSE